MAGDTGDWERVLQPESVAVFGISEDERKLGHLCLKSLLTSHFPGAVYPIHPRLSSLLGFKVYPSLAEVPAARIDLAMICLPSSLLLETLDACALKNVKGAVAMAIGFKETREEGGKKLQQEIASRAAEKNLKLIGPNTFGFLAPFVPLNATFTPYFSGIKPGPLAFLSQSGGACHFLFHFCYRLLSGNDKSSSKSSLRSPRGWL